MTNLATFPEKFPDSGVHGFVHDPPAGLGKPFTVIVPSFSADHVFEIERWQSRGSTLPAVGDEVLVVEDDAGEPWVPAWWPAAGDTDAISKEGIGMVVHLADGSKARPTTFAHYFWVGSAEPEHAIEYDQWVKPE